MGPSKNKVAMEDLSVGDVMLAVDRMRLRCVVWAGISTLLFIALLATWALLIIAKVSLDKYVNFQPKHHSNTTQVGTFDAIYQCSALFVDDKLNSKFGESREGDYQEFANLGIISEESWYES